MKKIPITIYTLLLVGLFALPNMGCSRAKEATRDTGQAVERAARDAADATGDALEDAADAVKDAAHDINK